MPGQDRFYIDNNDKDLYRRLKEQVNLFSDRDNKDMFIFAVCYGFKNDFRKSLSSKFGFVRAEYLKEDDWALLKVLAVKADNIEVLNNQDKIIEIAEEYAHGGIELLIKDVNESQYDSFEKNFELLLFELVNQVQ